MTDRPLTYEDIWDQYANGTLSTCVLTRLLRDDEVFAAWCKRKVDELKKARPVKAEPVISDEDMA